MNQFSQPSRYFNVLIYIYQLSWIWTRASDGHQIVCKYNLQEYDSVHATKTGEESAFLTSRYFHVWQASEEFDTTEYPQKHNCCSCQGKCAFFTSSSTQQLQLHSSFWLFCNYYEVGHVHSAPPVFSCLQVVRISHRCHNLLYIYLYTFIYFAKHIFVGHLSDNWSQAGSNSWHILIINCIIICAYTSYRTNEVPQS